MAEKKDTDHAAKSEVQTILQQDAEEDLQELNSPASAGVAKTKDVREDKENESNASSGKEQIATKDKQKSEKELQTLLEKKEGELLQKHDWLLRTQAEFENYKKRMVREKADLLKFGNESLMRELLPIIDDLERSLEHAGGTNQIDTIVDGIEIIKKEFLKKLEKFGLKQITAQGELFDPLKHEAIAQIETSEYPADTIVEELQKGYFIHDRLLRPTMVKVAKPPFIAKDDRDGPEKSKE